ncbi:hypothetical protein ZHAS_00005559 [Anopheles sinensis]|uniref:Uncharacterized protein n=1 Tax=Anopheles sinensis TaxID=74873 RepID=A0A084VJU1_ANOSI|nr:hypothetical protein ZHAS_00005559 [Anopheles sinensis]
MTKKDGGLRLNTPCSAVARGNTLRQEWKKIPSSTDTQKRTPLQAPASSSWDCPFSACRKTLQQPGPGSNGTHPNRIATAPVPARTDTVMQKPTWVPTTSTGGSEDRRRSENVEQLTEPERGSCAFRRTGRHRITDAEIHVTRELCDDDDAGGTNRAFDEAMENGPVCRVAKYVKIPLPGKNHCPLNSSHLVELLLK